jgi:hypothetical protein
VRSVLLEIRVGIILKSSFNEGLGLLTDLGEDLGFELLENHIGKEGEEKSLHLNVRLGDIKVKSQDIKCYRWSSVLTVFLSSKFNPKVSMDLRHISGHIPSCNLELSKEINLNLSLNRDLLFHVLNPERVVLRYKTCLPVINRKLLRLWDFHRWLNLARERSISKLKFRKTDAGNLGVDGWEVLCLQIVHGVGADRDNDTLVCFVKFHRFIDYLI